MSDGVVRAWRRFWLCPAGSFFVTRMCLRHRLHLGPCRGFDKVVAHVEHANGRPATGHVWFTPHGLDRSEGFAATIDSDGRFAVDLLAQDQEPPL